MFSQRSIFFTSALVVVAALPAQARVVRFDVTSREPAAFGYDAIVAVAHLAERPADAANRAIVDLPLAPRDAEGEVEATCDVVALVPHDASSFGGSAIIDIPNRGGATIGVLDHARSGSPYGDGFVMRHGFAAISIGWQFDVPATPGLLALHAPIASERGAPIFGLVRSDFHVDAPVGEHEIGDRGHAAYPFADPASASDTLTVRGDVLAPRIALARGAWHLTGDGTRIALDGGFAPGNIYELVYRARDPVVVGLGFAAVRDVVAYLKHDPTSPLHVARAYGFGISQSGRFLRMFVQRGFDRDEAGRPVFDGIMPIVSGPALGSFDHRFAQPSRDAAAFSSFFYPTDVPPFHEAEWPLPPELKVIDIVTSHEYWGRTASLMTTTDDGTRDLALPANVRFYAMTGGTHITGLAPEKRAGMRQIADPLDYRYVERAMLVKMDAWVRDAMPPPPSRYPRIDDGTLVAPSAWTFPAIPGVAVVDPAIALHRTWRYDFGPHWNAGIDEREPPGVGAPYVTLVPSVDADGIDRAGVKLPEVAAPLGTYTGWNLRDPATGFGDRLVDFIGSFIPFDAFRQGGPAFAGDALQPHDPRRSVFERYGDRAGYLQAYDAAAHALAAEGYILPEDIDALHARALDLWSRFGLPAPPTTDRR